MFKSLQTRIVSVLVIIVMLIMAIVGMIMFFSVSSTYKADFKQEMSAFFSDRIINEMTWYSNENDTQAIINILDSNYSTLKISGARTVMLLNADDKRVVSTSNNYVHVPDTNSINRSLRGNARISVSYMPAYIDYALAIPQQNPRYVVYIIDTDPLKTSVLTSIVHVMFICLIIAVLMMLIVSYFLARRLTRSLQSITLQAESVAKGNFEDKIDVVAQDEIGKLAETLNDMTDTLKSTFNNVKTEKMKVDTIISNMTDGIISFNKDGDVQHVNPAAEVMLNIEDKNKVPNFDLFFSELGADIKLGELLYLEHIGTVTRDIHTDNADLKAFFAVYDEKDDNGGVIVVLQDITQQEALENSRREFVANVSHELRTPLTTMKSYTESLIDGAADDPGTRDKFLEIILNEIERMIRLVQDLLVLSRLDFSKTQMHKDLFSLRELVLRVVDKFQISSKERGQHLKCHMHANVQQLYGDKHRLEQVLDNIVGNAIKYTNNGGNIDVYCKKLYNDIEIRVIDSGMGIPKDDLPRIFERFYRVDKARSREYGGTGLGLAIARDIVEAHGGTITINSVLGEGTEVIITLPAFTVDEKRYKKQ